MVTTKGIHHITAIASNAEHNFEFYTKILGLRLVKKTVNQDDVETYHLFFGDKLGHPGMDLTFFIFLPATQGYRGNGLVTTISLAVPEKSLEFWVDRLQKSNIENEGISQRFGKKRIVFYDEDDQKLELVAIPESELDSASDVWTTAEVSSENAIRHFYSASLSVHDIKLVEPILTYVFGYQKLSQKGNTTLYCISDSKRAALLEVIEDKSGEFGLNAAGTVHHIAFRAENESHQAELKAKVEKLGLQHTTVIDRFYFKSVYFRTPAGILFEIATDGPGFTADEKESELGKKLALPPFLEEGRKEIEAGLVPLPTE
jgi:glyoxalase family protein